MAVNELDKQIARMKGWTLVEKSIYGNPCFFIIRGEGQKSSMGMDGTPLWSEDEAQALDLADELTEALFEVTISSRWTPETGRRHRVTVTGLTGTPEAFQFKVEGASRPEAICRAWIAAREWIATKGEA